MMTTRSALACVMASILIAGCEPDTSGENRPPNPAQSVFKSFDTFTLEDQEGLPAVLPNTLFYDIYRGLEPAEGEDDQNTASAIRGRLDQLMGLTPSEDGTTYVAARNPIDFLNHVINSNEVDNFNEGRRLMRDVITRGVSAFYNTPQNNAVILFSERTEEPEANGNTLSFPLLDWRNNTPTFGTVATARRFDAGSSTGEFGGASAEVQDVIWSARFDEDEFSVSGYNQPDFGIFSLTANTLGTMELQSEYAGLKRDVLFMAQPPQVSETPEGERCQNQPPEDDLGLTFAEETPDCIRIVMNYVDSEVQVFTSTGEAPLSSDCQTFNENYCSFKRVEDGNQTLVYQSITIDSRQ